jgi:uncharacterized damage-inducible protein DinB
MELNPYAKFLGKRDPLEVLETTHPTMLGLFKRFTRDQLEQRPAPEKWSAREIVVHLADCETVYSFRLRQALAQDNPIQQPWDEKKWATRYANHDFDAAVRMFDAVRNWNLLLLYDIAPAERQRPTSHPERGDMTLWTIVQTMAGHDINHLQQLERLADMASPAA